jgi:hypothetical protein
MARGWESKSVEQQQEEATSEKTSRVQLSPGQIEEANRLRSLELSRSRILQQLEAATNPRHRQMLETALSELNRQLHGKS